ncbi:hypothetical protein [Rheinheimera mangrovi]|jgi:hypothetical protein|uniref:hypothetical protein n=1 Tax=Rheinheimera mangrovi TaxID=2498451 RepID=UPI000F8D9D8A|nr:hypothetical protein [Rheinheimera mangrovi]
MKSSIDEKIALEHQAAKLFMRLYQHKFGVKMQHIWHNEPAKPDVSCYLEQQRLDLEIAHLYGSEAEAMKILGRELKGGTLDALQSLSHFPVAERLLQALDKLIMNKAQKSYDSEKVWLVIRNAHPDWHAEELEQTPHLLQIPSKHPFEQIWLVADMTGQAGLVPLYPLTLEKGER